MHMCMCSLMHLFITPKSSSPEHNMDHRSDEDYVPTDSGSETNERKIKNKTNRVKKPRKSSSSSTSTLLSAEYLADIKQTFERFDVKNEGKFETKQLKFAIRALGFEPKKEEIKKIIEEFGSDGYIKLKDFTDLMTKRFTEKTVNEEIMKAFQLFDNGQTGKITFDDLKRVSNELGEKINDEELWEMIEEADLNGDKVVDCQEFLRIMKKTCLY